MAAQNLGAKQPGRAEKSGWLGASVCTAIMVAASLALWIWGTSVIRLFNSEPDMLTVGYAFLKIQILSYLFLGYATALQSCLNVIGDTLPAMLIVLVSTFAVQIPLAYALSQHTGMGAYGTRWAIVISTVVMGAGYALYFRLGRWKRKSV
jgi:Na+-driven multidrug efflux pump